MVVYAGVEGGGTTWRVALAEGHPTNIVESKSFPTLDNAQEQLREIKEWLSTKKYDSLGIGTFGPIDPRKGSPTYGYITTTPKPGWKMVDIVGALSDGSVPCKFDTDVNAPALAEYLWGKGHETLNTETSCAYITVGTGIGVGLVVNGRTVHGLLHPEAGHLCLRQLESDKFPGVDGLFGGSSVEGLASTIALASRKNCRRDELPNIPDEDEMWNNVAHALAGLCASLILVVSPERIVLSGGVMNRKSLYPKVRQWTKKLLNGYIDLPTLTTDEIDNYITPSSFGQKAGIIGSLTLAQRAYEDEKKMDAGPATSTDTSSRSAAGGCHGKFLKKAGYVAAAAAFAGAALMAVKCMMKK